MLQPMKRGLDIGQLKEIQKSIAKGISLKDDFCEIKSIAGFDLAFQGKKVICSAVVLDYNTFEILESKYIITEEVMPYSQKFVCFREAPAYIEAFKELEIQPDILMLDGQGAMHPKVNGIASHVGVLLNKPCIGVSSKLVFGKLDVDNIVFEDKIVGKALKTKDFANPIFVSPGHKLSLDSAVEITQKCLRGHKMPEPIHAAHNYVIKLKRKFSPESDHKVL